MSSGTGSTGAAAMAMARGLVDSPVRVETPAGRIDLRFDGDIFLTGPAEIVAEGVFLRAWRHSARANQPAPRYNNRS